MIAKNTLNFIVLFLVFEISYGSNHHHKVNEIYKFCHNNGHKFIDILDQVIPNFRTYFYSVMRSNYNIRGRFVTIENLGSYNYIENLKTLTGNRDFLIIEKDKSIEFSEILKIMNTRKIQKSLLVINEDEVQEFKVSKI